MKKGTTTTGFKFEFDETGLSDMRLVDQLAVVADEKAPEMQRLIAISKTITLLLGEKEKDRLYAHIGKKNNGRVPAPLLEKALQEILTASAEGKNS